MQDDGVLSRAPQIPARFRPSSTNPHKSVSDAQFNQVVSRTLRQHIGHQNQPIIDGRRSREATRWRSAGGFIYPIQSSREWSGIGTRVDLSKLEGDSKCHTLRSEKKTLATSSFTTKTMARGNPLS